MIYPSDVAAGHNARPSNKSGTDVGDDGTIKVWHYHDIKLTRTRDELHGTEGIVRIRAGEKEGGNIVKLTCCQQSYH